MTTRSRKLALLTIPALQSTTMIYKAPPGSVVLVKTLFLTLIGPVVMNYGIRQGSEPVRQVYLFQAQPGVSYQQLTLWHVLAAGDELYLSSVNPPPSVTIVYLSGAVLPA